MGKLIGFYSPEARSPKTKLRWGWSRFRFEKLVKISMTIVGRYEENTELFISEKDYKDLVELTASGWTVEITFDPGLPEGHQLCSLNPTSFYNAQHALIFGRSIM